MYIVFASFPPFLLAPILMTAPSTRVQERALVLTAS
jgi:hypothetical protein